MKGKRGQGVFGMSFGMIFSIIIIIAIIAISFYVIQYFMSLNSCTKIGFFYDGLQGDVDGAWQAGISQDSFSGSLPRGIDYVCFGNFSLVAGTVKEKEIQRELEFSVLIDNVNTFLYPVGKACDGDLAAYNLKHVSFDRFFCLEVVKDKVEIKIEKESTDALVRIGE